MKKSFRNFVLFFALALLVQLPAAAQGPFSVTLKLSDSATGEPVGFATVSLTRSGAKEPAAYALSAADGSAKLEKVRAGKYTLRAEIMGYKTVTQEVELSKATDLGTIRMEPDQRVLDAASVSAVGNPIVVKKDTVEYNASSYKISDNDVLEDLLKKLPGVEVAEDGTVTANGETITKITIDGKTFFLDDPQLASKNIPAKIIQKVKVVKKKSEQAEFTGISDGEEETVIDLSVQKGMMNGMFGNAMLGGGHDIPQSNLSWKDGDYRYQGSLMAGRFTDKSQISVILNGNNTNNRGFNDMSGSMMTQMRGGGGGMGQGGGGFGGGGNGITTSWMAGVNGAFDLFDDKMDLGSNYLYNHTARDVAEEKFTRTKINDSYYQHNWNNGYSSTTTGGHRFGIQLEHKFSENTSILFRPQVNFGGGSYHEFSRFKQGTSDDLATPVDTTNRGFTNSFGENRNLSTRGMFLFRQRLGLPGRTLSFNFNWNISNNFLDGFNQTENYYYRTGKDSLVNQRIDQESKSRSLSGRLVYTEPLGNFFYLEGSYQYSWSKSTSDKVSYDSGPGFDFLDEGFTYVSAGEKRNDTYSNQILNRYINQSAGLTLMYQNKGLTGQIGISANPTNTHNETNGESYDSKVVNWAPRAMLFYDFNDNSNLRFFYFGRSAQPSTRQLMPVMDNTNPLSVSLGNPNLKPYFNHNIRTEFRYTNKETFFTVTVNANGGYVQNPIVNAIWTGNSVRYSFPVNGKDNYNGNIRLMVNAPIAKSGFSLMSMTNASYSRTNSYEGRNLDMSAYFNARGEFDYDAFNRDYGDIDHASGFYNITTQSATLVERVRAQYRMDDLELSLSARTRYSHNWYTNSSADPTKTFNNQISGSVTWGIGDTGIEFKTEGRYNWYRGYDKVTGYNGKNPDPEFVVNASLSKLLFKKQATLALRAYDIFSQAKNQQESTSNTSYSLTRNNTLGRYIILSLTWRFGNFGNALQQMQGRMGPGGPPMGGGRRF